jgi:4-hydroxythreonine-4-phosphate dehydrogenase
VHGSGEGAGEILTTSNRPRLGITLGDPRGVGPELTAAALQDPQLRDVAEFVVIGHESWPTTAGIRLEAVGEWPAAGANMATGSLVTKADAAAGRIAGAAIERGIELALAGRIDGLVTGPISKQAINAAGYSFPGHTEFLRDRTGVPEVTMMMTAEQTPLHGPLRLALLTAHIPLREVPTRLDRRLVVTRTRIALQALRDWWGFERPRICIAGINPHASEGGLFGDEEARTLEPAVAELTDDGGAEILGIVPADTAFLRCIEGEVDLIVVPYHDVGLAVLKTLARDSGVNITAGLPFPRTSPDHGTAFDIAGKGIADPGATRAAIELCARFCRWSASGRRETGRGETKG